MFVCFLSSFGIHEARGGKRDHVEVDEHNCNTSVGAEYGDGTKRRQATCVWTPVNILFKYIIFLYIISEIGSSVYAVMERNDVRQPVFGHHFMSILHVFSIIYLEYVWKPVDILITIVGQY